MLDAFLGPKSDHRDTRRGPANTRYADLMTTTYARNLEAAKLIYDSTSRQIFQLRKP